MEQGAQRAGDRFGFESEEMRPLWHEIRDMIGSWVMLLGWNIMTNDGRFDHVCLMEKALNDNKNQSTRSSVT